MIRIKRAYDPPEAGDGLRFLVDRLWPRGVSKENLHLDGWQKDVAPSDKLRRWFNHEPSRWEEFRVRYEAKLRAAPDSWRPLLEAARQRDITLVYGAHDPDHNNAVALRSFLAGEETIASGHRAD